MSIQNINHKVQYADGTLVDFHKEHRVLKTEINVWNGRVDFDGSPVAQTGMTITYTVSRGDWVCLEETCGFRGTHKEALHHTSSLSHSTFWEKETL